MLKKFKKIIISPGEPAGIGPDLVIQMAQSSLGAELIAVGDPNLFLKRAHLLKLPLTLAPYDENTSSPSLPHTLTVLPVPLRAECTPGILNAQNAEYVIACLQAATDFCLQNKADALVTGPIHKSVINDAKIPFTGHTEFLKSYCQSKQTLMLFLTPQMKVGIATTHIPLSAVPTALTIPLLVDSIRLLHNDLIRLFDCPEPTILVCGLNPHAGESGHLGREEIEIITPALELLRTEKINCLGPLPADSIFNEHYLKTADAIFALYHDQALPVIKYASFNEAVNVTLGLPIIRTSVDHGTALELAGTGKANAGSFLAATEWAIKMVDKKFGAIN